MAGTVGLNYGWLYCHAQTRRLVSANTHTHTLENRFVNVNSSYQIILLHFTFGVSTGYNKYMYIYIYIYFICSNNLFFPYFNVKNNYTKTLPWE